MEFAPSLTNLRTQLCVVVTGYSPQINRESIWGEAAEEFLRRMHKLGVHMTIVGPRPQRKFGSKKTVRFMDRHEVVGMKLLTASRSHRLEFRVLNAKTRSWTRIRAEACVTIGPHGVWPATYDGWTLPGTLTIDALARWVGEQKWVPGRKMIFLGSSNRVLRWASILLDHGVHCTVVETGRDLRCWRSYRDRFCSKGGHVLLNHQVQRVELESTNSLKAYLSNEQGTLVLDADTVVIAAANDDTINAPEQWKKGLFYLQRRSSPWDAFRDEEEWLEKLDWRELYWRVARLLDAVDYAEADGALRALRSERRELMAYRRPGVQREFNYSGKILARETLSWIQSSPSVPRSFEHSKPVASLECLEAVPCRVCADACPDGAIEFTRLAELPRLIEDRCTGCGACVAACPAGVAVMVREQSTQQKARYFLPDDTKEIWREGRQLQLLNRRGELLGTGRVVSAMSYEDGLHRIVEIESANVYLWEARTFRIPPGERIADAEQHANSPLALKRGWVTLNGIKRMCPVDVPITVALWQLGQRRFEDALFCHDGSCHLCEVVVDGRPALACKTPVRDGQKIDFGPVEPANSQKRLKNPLCHCRKTTATDGDVLRSEGVSETLVREITGLGHGTCHGRWCLSSSPIAAQSASAKGAGNLRPVFHGYEMSPWRDLWAIEVAEIGEIGEGSTCAEGDTEEE